MTDLDSNIEKLKDIHLRNRFKIYVFEKIEHMPSDVALLSWINKKFKPSTMYQKLLGEFIKHNS